MQHKVFRLFFVLTLVIGLALVPTPQSVRAAGQWYVSTTGNDADNCLSPNTACATLAGPIDKQTFVSGDLILIAEGIYLGSISQSLIIAQDANFIGGWNPTFNVQSGFSTIDGQNLQQLFVVGSGVTSSFDHLILQNAGNNQNPPHQGGAIYNWGTLTITNSIIQNSIANYGGGIYNEGSLTLNNTNVKNNSSSAQTGEGGGIYSIGNLVLNNSIISGNTSLPGYTSHGIGNSNGSVILNNSTVKGNTGGILNWNGSITLNNSTVSNNTVVNSGGSMVNVTGTITLNNSTVTANSSTSNTGGIFNNGGTVTLQNSILAGNTSTVAGPNCSGTITSSGYNIIGNTIDCILTPTTGDRTDIDPLLGPLVGIPGYHPLLQNGPAIDSGNPAGCTDQDGNLLTADQRGVARVDICDIGAYEYTTPGPAASLSVVGRDNQSTTATLAFPNPLQAAALDSQGSPVSGVTIDFTAPASGPSGIFTDTGTNTISADTDAGGVATTSTFTANDQAGTYTVSASASGLDSVNFYLEQVDRPANDNFADAVAITSVPFSASADITNASTEPGEPDICVLLDKSVWYSFMPAETMLVTTYIQENIGFSNINVYRGNGGGIDNLSFLTCQGNNSPYTFLASAGQTYYLQVGTIPGFDGTIQVHLDQVPAPANDQFADAINIGAVPVLTNFDIGGATLEDSEPTPSCLSGSPFFESVWYVFSPSENASLSATLSYASFSPVMAVYSGASFNDLTALGCGGSGNTITFQAVSGQTYYFQIGSFYPELGSGSFLLEMTRPPVASFYYYPGDPSKYDTIQFQDNSYDPGNLGIQTYAWNFGDGSVASGYSSTHKYAADGDYQVTHTVTTVDGRTASAIQTVQVRTHDVAITKIAVPASANVGQTKTITVTLRNIAYPETVQIDLYKSTPNGFEYVATVTRSVAALSGNRTTSVNFSYKFTSDDARLGKVTFKAVVTIIGARDAFPADNEKISTITKVAR